MPFLQYLALREQTYDTFDAGLGTWGIELSIACNQLAGFDLLQHLLGSFRTQHCLESLNVYFTLSEQETNQCTRLQRCVLYGRFYCLRLQLSEAQNHTRTLHQPWREHHQGRLG